MALDWSRDDATVAVIGAGAMGRGIAQVAAQGGLKVLLFDAASGAAEKARAYIAEMLDGAAKKGRLAPGASSPIGWPFWAKMPQAVPLGVGTARM